MPLLSFMPFQKKAMSAGVPIMLSILFMWISADFVYGEYAEMVRNTMMIYFFLFLIPYTVLNQTPKSVMSENIWNFFIGFLGTGTVLFIITQGIGIFGTTAVLSEPFVATITVTGIGFGVLHAFVKAYIEESVFRWALPKYAGLGDILSSVLFGLFHLSILVSFTIPSMVAAGTLTDMGAMNWTYAGMPVITLTALGVGWSKVRDTIGVIGSTGSHTAWNMFALGILPRIFMGGMG